MVLGKTTIFEAYRGIKFACFVDYINNYSL